jgi:urease accessory protein
MPAAFVSAVLVGFAAGIAGIHVVIVEPMIAASIVALGLLIAFAVRAPVWLGALIAGGFAFFHGHAHGTAALTAGFAPASYATGFSLATAALHTIGLGAGYLIARTAGESFVRATGALVATGGVALMACLA